MSIHMDEGDTNQYKQRQAQAQALRDAYAKGSIAEQSGLGSNNSSGLGQISTGGTGLGPYQPTYPARQACPNCGYCPHCGRGNGYYQQPYYWSNQNYQGGSQAIPMGSVQSFNQTKQG